MIDAAIISGMRRRNVLFGAVALLAVPVANAIEIRAYSPGAHDRFQGFPANPVKNEGQDFASLDLSGIGWFVISPGIQFALISRQHVVFASHFSQIVAPSNKIGFLSDGNVEITRTAPTKTIIQDAGVDTDITVLTLNEPIDASTGVRPLAFLPINDPSLAIGLQLGVCGINPSPTNGKFPVIARGVVADIPNGKVELDVNEDGAVDYSSDGFRFDYWVASGAGDDCYFYPQGGDSGSPSFVDYGGEAALVGLHSSVRGFASPLQPQVAIKWENFDALIPAYESEINGVLNSGGYRMRPVSALPTTLSGQTSTVQATPRRSKPLDLEFEIANAGSNLTGNLEVEFCFEPDSQPDSVTSPGWVTYGSGEKWTLRKATMTSSETDVLTVSWNNAPSLDQIEPTVVWRSDTVVDESLEPIISLAPSFDDWAADLTEGGQNDDPDGDLLVNLLEYALGGDPESGVMVFADGGPLQPVLERDGNQFSFSFPERSDKVIRGLSYALEFSSDLSAWSSVAPGGMVSSTEPYAPGVEGFVKSIHSWAATPSHRFVRLRVLLNE